MIIPVLDVDVWLDADTLFWHVPHGRGTASPDQTEPGVGVAWVQ
jgi:hypothetical protein